MKDKEWVNTLKDKIKDVRMEQAIAQNNFDKAHTEVSYYNELLLKFMNLASVYIKGENKNDYMKLFEYPTDDPIFDHIK